MYISKWSSDQLIRDYHSNFHYFLGNDVGEEVMKVISGVQEMMGPVIAVFSNYVTLIRSLLVSVLIGVWWLCKYMALPANSRNTALLFIPPVRRLLLLTSIDIYRGTRICIKVEQFCMKHHSKLTFQIFMAINICSVSREQLIRCNGNISHCTAAEIMPSCDRNCCLNFSKMIIAIITAL